jgi:hypothetical protein
LRWSLNDVVHLFCLWDLFRIDVYLVLCVAEFASPNLLFLTVNFLILIFTIHIEGCIASSAKDWVACCQFGAVLERRHIDTKHVGIDFLLESSALSSLRQHLVKHRCLCLHGDATTTTHSTHHHSGRAYFFIRVVHISR